MFILNKCIAVPRLLITLLIISFISACDEGATFDRNAGIPKVNIKFDKIKEFKVGIESDVKMHVSALGENGIRANSDNFYIEVLGDKIDSQKFKIDIQSSALFILRIERSNGFSESQFDSGEYTFILNGEGAVISELRKPPNSP
jgi:hypothetical protein